MNTHRKIAAAVIGGLLTVGVLASAASADPPNFNPGQKSNVCDAPGPNSNPNCRP